MKEVREREREENELQSRAILSLVGYKQNQEEAGRMETLTPPSLTTGGGEPPGSLVPRQIIAAVTQTLFFFN